MTRRSLFGLLAGAIAGATLDPERLLWVPGKKLISIPAVPIPAIAQMFSVGDIITIAGQYARNPRTWEPLPNLQEFKVGAVASHRIDLLQEGGFQVLGQRAYITI